MLRNLTLPFKGRDEIRRVLKFEAESHIHSRSIDEVVVDAIHIAEREQGTELFMAACPKDTLSVTLKGLNKAGFDPERADLSAALLVEAADALGIFAADQGGEAGAAPPIDIVLELGAGAITMIVVEDGALKTVRVLRWGVDRLGSILGEQLGITEPEATAALDHFFGREPRAAEVVELTTEPEPAAAGTGEPGEAAEGDVMIIEDMPAVGLRDTDVAKAAMVLAERIGREALRFLTGSELLREPRRVLVTGLGANLPGMSEALETSLEVPVQPLELFERAEVAGAPETGRELEVAFAAAMAGIGAAKPALNFRQEELAFRPKFDRLKFPLAIMTMFLVVWQVAVHINHRRVISQHEAAIGTPAKTKKARAGPRKDLPVYSDSSLLWKVCWPDKGVGTLNEKLDEKEAERILRQVAAAPPTEKTKTLLRELDKVKTDFQKATGYFADLKLPSGLAVLQAFADAVDKADKLPAVGSFVIPKIELVIGATKSSPGKLAFTLAVRGDEEKFRLEKAAFVGVLEAACGPSGPFKAFRQEGKELVYPSSLNPGGEYNFILDLNPAIPIFQRRAE
jgi:Tfp pilus assembly PilM family ATPase